MTSKRPNPSRFQTPAPAPPQAQPTGLDDALDRCAVRRLQQLAERPPPPSEGDDRATLAGRKGKVALHNGQFLRRTLAGVESHNRRVTLAALARPEPPAPRFVRGRSRSRSRSRSPSSSPDAMRKSSSCSRTIDPPASYSRSTRAAGRRCWALRRRARAPCRRPCGRAWFCQRSRASGANISNTTAPWSSSGRSKSRCASSSARRGRRRGVVMRIGGGGGGEVSAEVLIS